MPINYRKISIERLHQCLSYIPDTGEFIHKPRIGNDRGAKIFNSQWAGKPAGTRRHDGHIFIVVDAYRLPAARVAWAMFYGEWPEGEIHHRDGDPSCNSINNLTFAIEEHKEKKLWHILPVGYEDANRACVSIERLHECLIYDPDCGVFTHKARAGTEGTTKAWNSKFAGKPAGCISRGYLKITVDGKPLFGHRVAWAMFYGEWPDRDIDHINREESDCRIVNLRLATPSQNGCNKVEQSNNTSGHRGVSWHQERQKWRARIKINGKEILLGRFTNKEDAIAAYEAAAAKYHGEYRSV